MHSFQLGRTVARRQVVRRKLDLSIFSQLVDSLSQQRAVVQLGRTLEWGSRGRGFESRQPDIISRTVFYVYVLRSKRRGRRYVGSCENIDDRLRRHSARESKATRHGIPWILIHSECFTTRIAAVQKELYYKTGRGRDELARLES